MLSLASVMLATTATAQTAPQPAPQGGGALPAIDVQETAGRGTDGYQATQSTVARVPTPLLDTAQSITVIPQQVMREQNTTSFVEALRNVAASRSVRARAATAATTPTSAVSMRATTSSATACAIRAGTTRDTFATQQIEVLKGPSSFLFGRGSTGGVINSTTKTPEKRTFVDTEVSGQVPAAGERHSMPTASSTRTSRRASR